MRTKSLAVALATTLFVGLPVTVKSDMVGGIEITNEGVSSFYLAIGDFYNVPEEQVIVVRKRSIPDDEIPVVFFLASRARVAPDVIVSMRVGGSSWMDICLKYGITAEVFYVPVSGTPGPPYGKAYGHYKNKDKSRWKDIRLSDADVVNLVNLKFVSQQQGCSPDQVIQARSSGGSFASINHDIQKKKGSSSKSEGGNSKGKKKK